MSVLEESGSHQPSAGVLWVLKGRNKGKIRHHRLVGDLAKMSLAKRCLYRKSRDRCIVEVEN